MVKMINKDNLNEVVNKLEWIPLNTDVIISMNETEQEENELNLSNNTIKQSQFVLAVGSMVREVKVGDEVLLDMEQLSSQLRNTRDAENPVVVLNVFPVEIDKDITAAAIPSRAIKFIKKK